MKYLLDVNMPRYFGEWRPPDFKQVTELDSRWSDSKIWEFARHQNLIILTKDYDFYDRIIATDEPPPRVIHFRTGNMKLKFFKKLIETNWPMISELAESHKLVLVYPDSVDGVL